MNNRLTLNSEKLQNECDAPVPPYDDTLGASNPAYANDEVSDWKHANYENVIKATNLAA